MFVRASVLLRRGALFLLLAIAALALVAGAATAVHPAPTGGASGSYLSGATSETLNFTITNPVGTGAAAVTVVEFYVPAPGGTILATGHDGGTWIPTVDPGGKAIVFTAPVGENLALGASKAFRVRYAPPVYTGDTTEDWTLVSRDTFGENVTTSNPPNNVNWRPLGIEIFGIKDPAGAQDGVVSSNQTINFTVIVRNVGTNAVNGIRVRVAVGSEIVETATFNAAGGSSTSHDVGPLKLGGTLGARTVTASLQGVTAPVTRAMTLDVKRAPDLGSTLSSITNSTRFLSNHASAPLENRASAITVNARNVGQVDLTDVVTSLRVYNQAGQDRSTFFTITPATQTIASLPANAVRTTTFTLAPTGLDGDAPLDRYHINATFSFTDPNNNTSPTSQFHTTTIANRNPNGFLVVDHEPPLVGIGQVPAPATRPFQRDGPNELEFTFRVEDANLNASRIEVLALTPGGTAPPSAAPLAADCAPQAAFAGRVACRLPLHALGDGLFTARRDFAGYERLGAYDLVVRGQDEAGNPFLRALGTYAFTDFQPPRVRSLSDDNGGGVQPGALVALQAEVEDSYRVGRSLGDSVGALGPGVFLRARYEGTSEEVFPGDGLPLIFLGTAFSGNGTWAVQAAFPRLGSVLCRLFVVDAAGNVGESSVVHRLVVRDDVTAPVTTAFVGGTLGDGVWWRSSVDLRLVATDDRSGVAATYVVGPDGVQARTSDRLEGDGRHDRSYWSVDQAGNVEAAHEVVVRIDATPPVLEAVLHGQRGDGGWFRSVVTVDVVGEDLHSGLAGTFVAVDDGPFVPASSAEVSGDGIHRVAFFGRDVAGNQGPVQEVEVHIDTTPPQAFLLRPAPGKVYVLGMGVDSFLNTLEPVIVGTLEVQAGAQDNLSAIARVAFFVDGEEQAVDEAAPFAFPWDAGDEGPGRHTLRIVAYDGAGNSASDQRDVLTVPEGVGFVGPLDPCREVLAEPWCELLPRFPYVPPCGETAEACGLLEALPEDLPTCWEVLAEAHCAALQDTVAPHAAPVRPEEGRPEG